MRTGSEYLQSIEDERRIYLSGEQVHSVASHPAFAGIARTIASLYDISANPASGLTYTAPETGGVANMAFMIPRSALDLRARHEAITRWARETNGFVGRGPDHVPGFLAGFASAPDVFARAGGSFANNVTRFYRKLLTEDLYVTYVIIPPQVDKSRTGQNQEEAFLQVGAYEERDGGIVIRGAQMLGTASAVSNYLLVGCLPPLRPGDEPYAVSFVVPLNAPGLKLYPRRPYALGQPSTFDYPLSTRFDETDALVVFDDVLVPWEDVFVYRDVDLARAQFFETPAHILGNNQAQIRLTTKMQFLIGLARKVAATTRVDTFPSVQEMLGELASLAAITEGMVLASEAACVIDSNGVAVPNPRFLYGAMGVQAELYPRAIHLLRQLSGGGVIQVPDSYADLLSSETSPDIRRYIRSTGVPSEERIKLFKLVWDAIGSEFAGRHQQYEMFYAGAPHVVKGYSFRAYGYEAAVELVDAFLKTYSLEDAQALVPA